jgi:hypothetical protein
LSKIAHSIFGAPESGLAAGFGPSRRRPKRRHVRSRRKQTTTADTKAVNTQVDQKPNSIGVFIYVRIPHLHLPGTTFLTIRNANRQDCAGVPIILFESLLSDGLFCQSLA